MLIKPICLYGILILQNDFRENPTIFDPSLKPGSSDVQGYYMNFFWSMEVCTPKIFSPYSSPGRRNFRALGGGVKFCRIVAKIVLEN